MKKTFKGFTLIECIVALAILGIASLTMAQIYANVSQRNRTNHLVNTSLSNQMAHVEKYTSTEAVPIYFGATTDTADGEASEASTTKYPPHKTSKPVNNNYISFVRVAPKAADPSKYDVFNDETYSFPTDIYVLKSRDHADRDSDDTGYSGETEDNYNLRYKYIIGHSN